MKKTLTSILFGFALALHAQTNTTQTNLQLTADAGLDSTNWVANP